MSITKATLANMLLESPELQWHKCTTKQFVEGFFEAIKDTLGSGEDIKLSGFGCFVMRDKAMRSGRNPRTGEPSPICARRVVKFKAGQDLTLGLKGVKVPIE